jgi:predicted MPP superfamily phosphohydrolase
LLTGKLPALILIGTVVCLSIFGYFESRSIRTEHLRIETNKLPPETDQVKIVQISDVHLGLMNGNSVLKKITKKIQIENPDILVSTGDLLDGSTGRFPRNSTVLSQIRPRYGKYAVTGNHEYYSGLDEALIFMRESGFKVLRGEVATENNLINIAGVDDAPEGGSVQEEQALLRVKNGLFTLFLKHRPRVSENSIGLFDLQLSGHTHGGQIFPFMYIVKLQYPLPIGYVKVSKDSFLYTSRGTGTWGPQMRIFATPEITVVELVRKVKVSN